MANEKIPSLGFHHIALQVKDFDRERAFLKAIGMKPYAAWMSGPKQIMLFEIGDGGMVELFSCGTEEAEANNRFIHFAMHADDVEAAYALAIKAGAEPIMEPAVRPVPSSPVRLTLNCAFVRAPGGEQFEFFKILEAVPPDLA